MSSETAKMTDASFIMLDIEQNINEQITIKEPVLSLYHDLKVAFVQLESDSEVVKLMIRREEINKNERACCKSKRLDNLDKNIEHIQSTLNTRAAKAYVTFNTEVGLQVALK